MMNLKKVILFLFIFYFNLSKSAESLLGRILFGSGTLISQDLIYTNTTESDFLRFRSGLSYWPVAEKLLLTANITYHVESFFLNKKLSQGFGDLFLAATGRIYKNGDLEAYYSGGFGIPTSPLCANNPFSNSAWAYGQALTMLYKPKKFALFLSSELACFFPRSCVQRGLIFGNIAYIGYQIKKYENVQCYGFFTLSYNYHQADKCTTGAKVCNFPCFPFGTNVLIGPTFNWLTKNCYFQLSILFPIFEKSTSTVRTKSVFFFFFTVNF